MKRGSFIALIFVILLVLLSISLASAKLISLNKAKNAYGPAFDPYADLDDSSSG